MARKRKDNISEVTFSYIGTDAQFDEFLNMHIGLTQPNTKSCAEVRNIGH